jgi:hypothetical protein
LVTRRTPASSRSGELQKRQRNSGDVGFPLRCIKSRILGPVRTSERCRVERKLRRGQKWTELSSTTAASFVGTRASSEVWLRGALERTSNAGELYGSPETYRSHALEQNGSGARRSPTMAAAVFGPVRRDGYGDAEEQGG